MIIKKIEIQNFRSYYKENRFDLINGLNLIIGANGDGKTTFYEALEWLFRTDDTNKMDTKYISKKRCEDLFSDESDIVKVSISYEHKKKNKILEKEFRFTKSYDGQISTSSYQFTLTEDDGIERLTKDGKNFDKDLSSDVRQFLMFKGESDLDVFQESNALGSLVETFSDVKDFESYFSFMEYATNIADQARKNALKKDSKNEDKIKELNRKIESKTALLAEIDKEIRQKSDEAVNFEKLLKDLENSKEASELLKNVNRRIESLAKKRSETRSRINEEYTFKLLDDMWILLGFAPIASEYSEKISAFDKLKRKLNDEHTKSFLTDKIIKKIQTDFVPLPVHIPGQKIMQEMIDEEVCKICGRPATKHSEAWNYMVQRLEDYKNSIKSKPDEEEQVPPLYQFDFVDELQKRDTILNDNMSFLTKMHYNVMEELRFNAKLQKEVERIEKNLDNEYEQKKKILAQSDGLSEEQLLARFESISNWTNAQRDAEERVRTLKSKREMHREELEKAKEDLAKISEGTSAEIYVNVWKIISRISNAFKDAKETNKKNLLSRIEDESNGFLKELNVDDFKGTIRIIEKANGQGEAVLMNNDDTRIFNPNTALRTTYLMSVLFAIRKIASSKEETPYPLLFDAPTSSFDSKKEQDFYNVISSLGTQVIIVTKSFLKQAANGEYIVDYEQLKNLKGQKFHINPTFTFLFCSYC